MMIRTGKEILAKVKGVEETFKKEEEKISQMNKEQYEIQLKYQKLCLAGYTEYLYNAGKLEVPVIINGPLFPEIFPWLEANSLKLEVGENGSYILKVAVM